MKEYKPFIWLGLMALAHVFRGALEIVVSVIGFSLLTLVAIVLLFLTLALIASGLEKIKRMRFRKIYEGRYFLWYSSNKRLKGYIESELKPLLGMEYDTVFQNRKVLETSLKEDHYLFLLRKTEYRKLPRLICIRKGEPVSVSFYEELYRLKTGIISKEVFKRDVMSKMNGLKST